jgi:hypothetical protein
MRRSRWFFIVLVMVVIGLFIAAMVVIGVRETHSPNTSSSSQCTTVLGFEDLRADDSDCHNVEHTPGMPVLRKVGMQGHKVSYWIFDPQTTVQLAPIGHYNPKIMVYPHTYVSVQRMSDQDFVDIEVSNTVHWCSVEAWYQLPQANLGCGRKPPHFFDQITAADAAVVLGADFATQLEAMAKASGRTAVFALSCLTLDEMTRLNSNPDASDLAACPKA